MSQPDPSATLSQLIDSVSQKQASQNEIIQVVIRGIQTICPTVTVCVYILDPTTNQIIHTYGDPIWNIPVSEQQAIIKQAQTNLIQPSPSDFASLYYIPDRRKIRWTSPLQLESDSHQYSYPCLDFIWLPIVSSDELVVGFVIIHQWPTKTRLDEKHHIPHVLSKLIPFINRLADMIESHYIHQEIESWPISKKALKQRRQDSQHLHQRVSELSALHHVSIELADKMDAKDMVISTMNTINEVLSVGSLCILLLDTPTPHLFFTANVELQEPLFNAIQQNITLATARILSPPYPIPTPAIQSLTISPPSHTPSPMPTIQSFLNVPLVHKNQIIGMINVCSGIPNAFPHTQSTFIYTLANQLATHIGRIQLLKKTEWLRLESMMKVMPDGVVLTDSNGHVTIFNEATCQLVDLAEGSNLSPQLVESFLYSLPIGPKIREVLQSHQIVINEELKLKDKYYLVNMSPIPDSPPNPPMGVLIVIRDFTDVQKNNRIKAQRLDIISQAGTMIKSIIDIDNLLSLLMELILNSIGAEFGSIQLISQGQIQTKVHGNFPDKIRRDYRFKSGETITEFVARTRESYFIPHYPSDPSVEQSVKIMIDSYIAIPIMVKSEMIGIVSIARKLGNHAPPITQDDIRTLVTITSFSGTAIQNALMYQENMKTQRLDQEVKIAADIQSQLLPTTLPRITGYDVAAHSLPAREIGGDYYDFFELPNQQIGFALADIVGKGIPAGLFMAMLKSVLHSHAMGGDCPADTMNRLNRTLAKDPVMNRFVPMMYGVLDPKNGLFTYVNAGLEPLLHLSADTVTPLVQGGIPVGALEDTCYTDSHLHLSPGDSLLGYTDGLTDAKSPVGHRFSIDRLCHVLKQEGNTPPSNLIQTLIQTLRDFTRGNHLSDDVTIIHLKRNPSDDDDWPQGVQVDRVVVSSHPSDVKHIRRYVEKICHAMGFDNDEIFNIKLSINEAQANVIEHAYAGAHNGKIIFTFAQHADHLDVIMRDFGGGETQSIKGESHLDELEGSGLGLFLINTFMDRVQYKRMPGGGTELTLTKYLQPQNKGEQPLDH